MKLILALVTSAVLLGMILAALRNNIVRLSSPTSTPSATLSDYQPPKLANSNAYTIIFVGDSMTDALGENFDYLRADLEDYYPDKTFGLFNYGFGGTNILSVDERLNRETEYRGKKFPAILSRVFDVIIIESMGHNPLSEFPLNEGLKKQEETLDKIVEQIATTHPNSIIMFLATIAPSKEHYAEGVAELSPEIRAQWAAERSAYIENHIRYAKNHNIPLINVYEKSIDDQGNANLDYISKDNYIHPSPLGLQFISQEIVIALREVLPR